MGIICKIGVAGQTIRTLQLPHSETVDTQGFQNSYLYNFYSNERVLSFLIFVTEDSLCRKSNPKIGVTGQTIRTPRLPHF